LILDQEEHVAPLQGSRAQTEGTHPLQRAGPHPETPAPVGSTGPGQ
jgi:hypothetical protein